MGNDYRSNISVMFFLNIYKRKEDRSFEIRLWNTLQWKNCRERWHKYLYSKELFKVIEAGLCDVELSSDDVDYNWQGAELSLLEDIRTNTFCFELLLEQPEELGR